MLSQTGPAPSKSRYAARVRALVLCGVLCCLALSSGRARAQDGSYPAVQGYPVPSVGGTPMSPRKATLLRVLDQDLDRLADQSDGRILDGTLQLVVGGAFVTLGVLIDDQLFRAIVLLSGSVSIARGANTLALAPDAEEPFMSFRGMPIFTPADVEAKLRFGDAALARLAQRSRAARIVEGTLTMVGAAGYIPLYWGFRRADEPGYRFGDDGTDYFGVAISAVVFTSGLVTVLRKSSAERRNKAYRELKRELYGLRLSPTFGPQHAGFSVGARF
jgi:hypothetical protein